MDLLLSLRPDLPHHAAIELAIREAIVDGQLTPGAELPSSRELAAEIGVARGTVVAALEQLSAEGLLESQQGRRTRVAHVPPKLATPTPVQRPVTPRADFYGGDPDLTLFPRSAWKAAVVASLQQADAASFGYGPARGEPSLQDALVSYLGRTRGVVTAPDNVLITAGFTHSLAVLGRALSATGRRSIAVEDPSYWRHRELLESAGLDCVPIEVDDDGLRVEELAGSRASAVLVTPGHQNPIGVSLAPARRAGLATWAAHHDAIVLEDDYDGELRYDRRPLRAVQALDPARVVYCGSTSKALAPGLRLAWCIVPTELVAAVLAAQDDIGGTAVSRIEQLAVAELLRSGRYDAQVRRIRAAYRRRRDDLVAAVAARLPGVRIAGVAAGLKAVLRLPPGTDESNVVDELAQRGVAVAGLAKFSATSPMHTATDPAIVVNYGRPYAHQYRAALALLTGALDEVLRRAEPSLGPADAEDASG